MSIVLHRYVTGLHNTFAHLYVLQLLFHRICVEVLLRIAHLCYPGDLAYEKISQRCVVLC